jgi:hypothetical protein
MKEIANVSRTQNDDMNKLNQTIDRLDPTRSRTPPSSQKPRKSRLRCAIKWMR